MEFSYLNRLTVGIIIVCLAVGVGLAWLRSV